MFQQRQRSTRCWRPCMSQRRFYLPQLPPGRRSAPLQTKCWKVLERSLTSSSLVERKIIIEQSSSYRLKKSGSFIGSGVSASHDLGLIMKLMRRIHMSCS